VAVELAEMQVGGAVVVRQGAQRIAQEDLPARRHFVARFEPARRSSKRCTLLCFPTWLPPLLLRRQWF
jgi:hypothetical protein